MQSRGNEYVKCVREAIQSEDAGLIMLAVATESDIAELEDYEEKQLFLDEIGLEEPGVNRLIRAAYDLLDLQTYFTAGEKSSCLDLSSGQLGTTSSWSHPQRF